MNHYFLGGGADYRVNFAAMISDQGILQAGMRKDTRTLASFADSLSEGTYEVRTTGMGKSGTSSWEPAELVGEWFWALGTVRWAGSGLVFKERKGDDVWTTIAFKFHLFDIYDFDNDPTKPILGDSLTDRDMHRMHRLGWANEFRVLGTGHSTTVKWCGNLEDNDLDPLKTIDVAAGADIQLENADR